MRAFLVGWIYVGRGGSMWAVRIGQANMSRPVTSDKRPFWRSFIMYVHPFLVFSS